MSASKCNGGKFSTLQIKACLYAQIGGFALRFCNLKKSVLKEDKFVQFLLRVAARCPREKKDRSQSNLKTDIITHIAILATLVGMVPGSFGIF